MKTRFLYPLVLLGLAVSPVLFAQQPLPASTAATEQALPAFQAISVTDGIEVFVQQGPRRAIRSEASAPGLRRHIKAVVLDDAVLHVYFDASADPQWKGLVGSSAKLTVYVTVPELHALTAAKGATVRLQGTLRATQPLRVRLQSGARLEGNLQAESLTVSLRGGAQASLSGSATALEAHVVEGSQLRSPGLRAQTCVAYAASASQLQLLVSQSLEARSINEAVIRYSGEAVLRKRQTELGGRIVHI